MIPERLDTSIIASPEREHPAPISPSKHRLTAGIILFLALILALGAVYRLTGVNWDDYTHLHPDERFLTMVESALFFPGQENLKRVPPGCSEWGSYFNTACSPLDPYNHDFGLFVYGTFPIFVTRIAGEIVGMTGYDEIHLVGRVLSALFDLSTVLVLFFIGRRIYSNRVGLLASFFLAASVLDIQQSHFFTADNFTILPIALAFWYALDIAEGTPFRGAIEYGLTLLMLSMIAFASWAVVPGILALLFVPLAFTVILYADRILPVRYVLAGCAFGLALASRINIVFFAAVLVAAAALRAYLNAVNSRRPAVRESLTGTEESLESPLKDATGDGNRRQVLERSFGPISVSVGWREAAAARVETLADSLYNNGVRAFWGLTVAAIAALILFRIFQPYAANGPSFISPHIPKLDMSRGPVNFLFDVALSWAGGVNPKFADNMTYVSDLVAGKIDAPPGHQWTDRTPYVFPWDNMVEWGLGLPLGLAAWIGFLVALYQLLRYRRWEHLLVLVWVAVTFGYTGQQFVKTMRYFLQIYPFLSLLAAWLLVELWDASARAVARGHRWGKAARAAVAIGSLVVIGYTLFWATAFTTIYTRPYTRVAASRWFFDNVPPGSVIANEHWDDPVPVRVDGKDPFGGMYRSLPTSSDGEMHWYDEDTPEKRVQAIQWLDDADYIVLSSNRLYGSIPRLPMRYPMTTKYYQWLFDGTLGFQKVAEFTSRPQLFGVQINDDNAEEAFTVYDHPKVLVFKKSPQYSHVNTEALFNSVNLNEIYRFTPPEATQAPTALLLTPDQWSKQMAAGTWSDIFNPNDVMNRIPVVGWLAIIEILGWIAFPLSFVIFRALADRGYIFAKPIGILLTAWGVWMLASLGLIDFGAQSIFLVVVCLAIIAAVVVWLRRVDLISFIRSHWSVILTEETIYLIFFFVSLAIRYGNPDLWHPWYGGEKPLDFAYLNAVTKSSIFPAYDPWFAGGYINYYYFGQVISATLVRLSGIVPEVAYNLLLPMFFAMTAMGAFSVVYNLIAPRLADSVADVSAAARVFNPRTIAFALLGAIFVAVIGNMGELILIGQTFWKIGGGTDGMTVAAILSSIFQGLVRVLVERQPFDVPIGWWYWNATRTIPDTINEFPFFTFLYADLHAHLMALPFTLLILGIAVNFVRRDRDDAAHLPFWPYWQMSPVDVLEIALAGLTIGALRAINYADFPTYLLVLAFALAIGEYGRRKRIDWEGIIAVAWRLIGLFVVATITFLPFTSHFATAYLATEPWKGQQTTLPQYLVVHGIFLFVIATFLIGHVVGNKSALGVPRLVYGLIRHSSRAGRYLDLHNSLAATSTFRGDMLMIIVGGSFLIEVALIFIQAGVFAVVFPFLVISGLLVLHPHLEPERRLVSLLIAAGLAMTLMVELITYKGDIGRMNTVFKFYIQVWVFFAISAAAGLAFLLRPRPERVRASRLASSPLATIWWGLFGLLVFIGLLYPVLATRAKVNDRFVAGSPPSLNGMDYMQGAVYEENNKPIELKYDREAINWLRENIEGSPVILEANGPLYHWTSRISIYTGLPTVVGWDWHQKQQRSIIDSQIVDNRIADVRTVYNTTNIPEAVRLLSQYRVSYIYVGDYERAFYDPVGIGKFDSMTSAGLLDLIYDKDHVKVYRVRS